MKRIILLVVALLSTFTIFPIYNKGIAQAEDLLHSNAVTVFRFWNRITPGHFFTADEDEMMPVLLEEIQTPMGNCMIDPIEYYICGRKWTFEGIEFQAEKNRTVSNTPVYRFYSAQNNSHFYTIDASEKNYIEQNYSADAWKYEGITFYVSSSEAPGLRPIYRFWSPQYKRHFFTISRDEKDHIIKTNSDTVWNYEGIAFYAKTFDQSEANKFIEDYFDVLEETYDTVLALYNQKKYWQISLNTMQLTDFTAVELDIISIINETIFKVENINTNYFRARELKVKTVLALNSFKDIIKNDIKLLVNQYLKYRISNDSTDFGIFKKDLIEVHNKIYLLYNDLFFNSLGRYALFSGDSALELLVRESRESSTNTHNIFLSRGSVTPVLYSEIKDILFLIIDPIYTY